MFTNTVFNIQFTFTVFFIASDITVTVNTESLREQSHCLYTQYCIEETGSTWNTKDDKTAKAC